MSATTSAKDMSAYDETTEFYGARMYERGCQLAYFSRPKSELLAMCRDMAKFLVRLPAYQRPSQQKEIAACLVEQGMRGYESGAEWLLCFREGIEPLFREKADPDIIELEAEFYQRDMPDLAIVQILQEFRKKHNWPTGS